MDFLSLEIKIVAFGICLVLFAAALAWTRIIKSRKPWKAHLNKHTLNPIFSPPPYSEWESIGTFNPAAIQDDSGAVHLIYRAIGSDGVSRFGYGRSDDGYNFSDRSPYPVFAMQSKSSGTFDPVMYPSGGSWGGAEDPKMVRLDGKVYIMFTAFDGTYFTRMAIAHIEEADFMTGRWRWSKPLVISPPNQRNKNWVLFPEKINGKFAILHAIAPNIMIDYIDRLEDLAFGFQKIQSAPDHFGAGWEDKSREKGWDYVLRGVGPPPIKTDKGWLVLYHALEKDARHEYKLGVMLLDLEDPTKVIARSKEPILCPTEWYENDWKPGVIYACGAIIKGDKLIVYYGGGDKHVCAADISLKDLFELLFKK